MRNLGEGCGTSSIILKLVKFTYHFPTPRPLSHSGEIAALEKEDLKFYPTLTFNISQNLYIVRQVYIFTLNLCYFFFHTLDDVIQLLNVWKNFLFYNISCLKYKDAVSE